MKARNFFQRFVNGCLLAAMAAASAYQPAAASEAMKDVSKEISDLRSAITSIELYTITTFLSFRIALEERDVVRMGCPYKAIEKDDIATLLDVLVGAQLSEPPEKIPTLEPRIVAYLHMRDGTVFPLVLTREFIEEPARGTYNQETLVVAKMGFSKELLRWRKEHKPVRWIELSCNDASTS